MDAEIIGVRHTKPSVKTAVMNYIDSKYPDLDLIRLELHPYHFLFDDAYYDDFFGDMAKHYRANGVEVICADVRRFDIYGLTPEAAIRLWQYNPVKFLLKERWGMFSGYFDGRLIDVRDKAMDEVFRVTQPDVVVVGGTHARYLKEQHQECRFTYFRPSELTDILRIKSANEKKADQIYLIP